MIYKEFTSLGETDNHGMNYKYSASMGVTVTLEGNFELGLGVL